MTRQHRLPAEQDAAGRCAGGRGAGERQEDDGESSMRLPRGVLIAAIIPIAVLVGLVVLALFLFAFDLSWNYLFKWGVIGVLGF